MSAYYEGEDQVDRLFEIVKTLIDNNNMYQDNLKDQKLSLKFLERFNTPAFKDLDYLKESKFDINVILTAIFNTPIQLGDRKQFRKMTYLLARELTDRVRRPRLTKIYYEKWFKEFIKRADDHAFATGTIILEVIQKLTQDTSSLFPSLLSELRGKVKEVKEE